MKVSPAEKFILHRTRGKYLRQWLKSVLWWAGSFLVLYMTARETRFINPALYPGRFWSIFAVLAVVPILRYALWRGLTAGSFTGTVETCYEKQTRIMRVPNTAVGLRHFNFSSLEPVPGLMVVARTRRGRVRKFIFKEQHMVDYARETYRRGDPVRYLFGSRYPVSPRMNPERDLCVLCGFFERGEGNDQVCPDCGCPFVARDTDHNGRFYEE